MEENADCAGPPKDHHFGPLLMLAVTPPRVEPLRASAMIL
jgi:hypothetical protein